MTISPAPLAPDHLAPASRTPRATGCALSLGAPWARSEWLLAALFLAGLAGTPTAEAKPPLASGPELVTPGSEPRARLRLHPKAGPAGRFSLKVDMESTQTVMGTPSRTRMPPTRIEGPVVVLSSSAKGFRIALTLEKITVEKGPGLQKGTTATLQRSWNAVLGARVRMRLSAQGALREAKMSYPAGVKPPESLHEPLAGFMNAVRQLAVPLPRQAVGQGAVWRTRSQSETGGATIMNETEWHLTSRPARSWTLSFETQSAAVDGADFSPGPIPKSMTVKLEELSGTTKGHARIWAARPVPMRLTAETHLMLKLSGRVATRAFTLSTAERSRTQFLSPEESPSVAPSRHTIPIP